MIQPVNRLMTYLAHSGPIIVTSWHVKHNKALQLHTAAHLGQFMLPRVRETDTRQRVLKHLGLLLRQPQAGLLQNVRPMLEKVARLLLSVVVYLRRSWVLVDLVVSDQKEETTRVVELTANKEFGVVRAQHHIRPYKQVHQVLFLLQRRVKLFNLLFVIVLVDSYCFAEFEPRNVPFQEHHHLVLHLLGRTVFTTTGRRLPNCSPLRARDLGWDVSLGSCIWHWGWLSGYQGWFGYGSFDLGNGLPRQHASDLTNLSLDLTLHANCFLEVLYVLPGQPSFAISQAELDLLKLAQLVIQLSHPVLKQVLDHLDIGCSFEQHFLVLNALDGIIGQSLVVLVVEVSDPHRPVLTVMQVLLLPYASHTHVAVEAVFMATLELVLLLVVRTNGLHLLDAGMLGTEGFEGRPTSWSQGVRLTLWTDW